MKKLSIFLLIASAIFMISCNSDSKSPETTKTETVDDTKKAETTKTTENKTTTPIKTDGIDLEKSIIKWSAEGVGHGHNGTINISSGSVVVKNGTAIAGKLIVDMNSIVCLDIKEADKNKDLIDHLIGEDFFNTAKFPNAYISLDDINVSGESSANMTIKDVSKNISIPLTFSDKEINSNFSIDRTKFGVTYNSKNFFKNLGDYMIDDEIKFEVKIVLN